MVQGKKSGAPNEDQIHYTVVMPSYTRVDSRIEDWFADCNESAGFHVFVFQKYLVIKKNIYPISLLA